jgi:hypothetical protein
MSLRVAPVLRGHHGAFLMIGQHLTATRAPVGQPAWTTHWRLVRTAQGATGYAYAPNLGPATQDR